MRHLFLLSALIVTTWSAFSTTTPGASESTLDSIIGLNEISVSAIKSTSGVMFPASVTAVDEDFIQQYDIDGV